MLKCLLVFSNKDQTLIKNLTSFIKVYNEDTRTFPFKLDLT